MMITPLTAQLLPPVPHAKPSPRTHNAPTKTAAAPPRADRGGLAASIAADGGLGFLQARLEEKVSALFEKAAAESPDLAAAGPNSFFDSAANQTPEGTADRIVGFALSMRNVYRQQNPELEGEEFMARFEAEIRRGIGDGFGHARGVLGELEVLEDQVQDNVNLTWDLVQQKLDEFFHPDSDNEAV